MPRQILIVDDSKTIRQQVAMPIKEAGYEVVEAVDGEDGIAQLEKSHDVAMIITDVNMPKMSGLDMIEAIHKAGKHSGIPIVMLTTESQKSLIARAKEAGAKAWIVKPFKPEQLVAAVRKLAGPP
jgi:two-component system, chemotaxis family, chemotaxis protein CheY